MTSKRTTGLVILVVYVCTIFAANWAITRFGVIPIGFGLMAPAGVFFAGLAFECRDLLQDTLGRRWCVAAILLGAALSALVSPQFAFASGVAFLLGELADFAIYTPLRRRYWLRAMLVANPIGAVVDSAIFLWLAFGSLDFLPGQVVGKAAVTVACVLLLTPVRRPLRVRLGVA